MYSLSEFNFIASPLLVVFMYIIVEFIKMTPLIKTDHDRKVLPLTCGLIGGAVAVLLHIFFPEALGCNTIFDAATMGAISGLAATGANQLFKQMKAFYAGDKNAEEEAEEKKKKKKEEEKQAKLEESTSQEGQVAEDEDTTEANSEDSTTTEEDNTPIMETDVVTDEDIDSMMESDDNDNDGNTHIKVSFSTTKHDDGPVG